MNISMLGAGAWGTALALAAAQRHDVLLWTRDAAAGCADAGAALQPALPARDGAAAGAAHRADHDAALRHARGGLLVIATPMAALRERLARCRPRPPVLWLCKGFEAGSGALGHEIARELRPQARGRRAVGAELRARGGARPADGAGCGQQRRRAVRCRGARPSTATRCVSTRSADPVGVEVGGAVKNVLAIATGLVDGLAAGRRPRARD